jgi:hypothetical protein
MFASAVDQAQTKAAASQWRRKLKTDIVPRLGRPTKFGRVFTREKIVTPDAGGNELPDYLSP